LNADAVRPTLIEELDITMNENLSLSPTAADRILEVFNGKLCLFE